MLFSSAILFSLITGIAYTIPTESPSKVVGRATYGSVVDTTDSKPATTSTAPGTLPNRNNGAAPAFTVGGNWSAPFPGSLGGDNLLVQVHVKCHVVAKLTLI